MDYSGQNLRPKHREVTWKSAGRKYVGRARFWQRGMAPVAGDVADECLGFVMEDISTQLPDIVGIQGRSPGLKALLQLSTNCELVEATTLGQTVRRVALAAAGGMPQVRVKSHDCCIVPGSRPVWTNSVGEPPFPGLRFQLQDGLRRKRPTSWVEVRMAPACVARLLFKSGIGPDVTLSARLFRRRVALVTCILRPVIKPAWVALRKPDEHPKCRGYGYIAEDECAAAWLEFHAVPVSRRSTSLRKREPA